MLCACGLRLTTVQNCASISRHMSLGIHEAIKALIGLWRVCVTQRNFFFVFFTCCFLTGALFSLSHCLCCAKKSTHPKASVALLAQVTAGPTCYIIIWNKEKMSQKKKNLSFCYCLSSVFICCISPGSELFEENNGVDIAESTAFHKKK